MPTAEATLASVSNATLELNEHELKRRVRERKDEALIEGGYLKEDADGNDKADYMAFRDEVMLIAEGHEINDADDEAKGLTDAEILAKALPEVEFDEDDPVDAKAAEQLAKRCGGFLQTGKTGYVQKHLPKGKVLIRKQVSRAIGKAKIQVTVTFVTTDHGIIMDSSMQPVVDAAVKGFVKANEHGDMIVGKVPALNAKVNKALTAGAKRATNTVRPALEAGE